jgi:hypothetical protein
MATVLRGGSVKASIRQKGKCADRSDSGYGEHAEHDFCFSVKIGFVLGYVEDLLKHCHSTLVEGSDPNSTHPPHQSLPFLREKTIGVISGEGCLFHL